MDLTKLLEKRAKKWPGIVQVASLLAVIMALAIHKSEKEFALWQTAFVLALAFFFHFLGTTLDAVVFAPLYGLKPSSRLKRGWRFMTRGPDSGAFRHIGLLSPIKLAVDQLPGTNEMATERKAAAEKLRGEIAGSESEFSCNEDKDCEGIYDSAKALFERSDDWDDNVKPWLQLSKAIRSFIWPLVAIVVYDLWHDQWRMAWLDDLLSAPFLNWLSWWGLSIAALFLALVLYLWLRVFHMRAMYKLVKNSEYIRLPTPCDTGTEYRTALPAIHLSIGEIGKPRKDKHKPVFLLIRCHESTPLPHVLR